MEKDDGFSYLESPQKTFEDEIAGEQSMTDINKEQTKNAVRDYGPIPEMKWIDIDLLKINGKYQRDTNGKRSRDNVKKIMADFKWADFTPITVSKEDSRYYNIIDGQHRYEAALGLGDISQLPCWVVDANVEKQAQAFIEINQNRVVVTPYAIYKAQLARGEYWAVEIEKFCNGVGIIIPFNGYCSLPNMTLALSTIKTQLKLHNNGYLAEAIRIIREAFPNRNGQIKSDIVHTLVDLKIECGDKLNMSELVQTLKSFGNVDKISAKAKELKALDGSLSLKAAHKKVFISKIKENRRGK